MSLSFRPTSAAWSTCQSRPSRVSSAATSLRSSLFALHSSRQALVGLPAGRASDHVHHGRAGVDFVASCSRCGTGHIRREVPGVINPAGGFSAGGVGPGGSAASSAGADGAQVHMSDMDTLRVCGKSAVMIRRSVSGWSVTGRLTRALSWPRRRQAQVEPLCARYSTGIVWACSKHDSAASVPGQSAPRLRCAQVRRRALTGSDRGSVRRLQGPPRFRRGRESRRDRR
jgi:hypothetical protein